VREKSWNETLNSALTLPFSRRQTTRKHTGDNTPPCVTLANVK